MTAVAAAVRPRVAGAAVALAAIVVAAAALYGSLGALQRGPSVFADELIYMDATRSIAGGHAPQERDRAYGRGLLFPAVAAPAFALAPNQVDAYRALRAVNAVLFALTAVPAFFLARRLLGRWWSVAVAGLSVAAPSSVYGGLVLTESTAYVTGTLALLALALAIERPTARRQLAALGAVALAALARPQLAALALAFPVGLAVRGLALPPRARPGRDVLRQLWPSAAAVAVAAALWLAALASGHVTLKDYRDVWQGYDVVSVARWSWYTLGDLALYLAVVPVVAGPAALAGLWRHAREGSTRDASFLGLLVGATVLTVVIVAAFSSATFGGLRLHDRYLFYIVPLWLVLFAVWLERGAAATTWALVVGGGLALALLATLPVRLLVRDTTLQFDAVASSLWSRLREVDPARPGALRLALVLAVGVALAAVLAASRAPALRLALLVPLVVVFAANAAIVWNARIADADHTYFADDRPGTWSWVDAAVPAGRRVADVFVDSSPCLSLNIGAFRWTEFFNERIGPVYRIGLPPPPGVVTDGESVRVGPDGVVRRRDGNPLRTRYVVAPPGLGLRGRRVADGTLADLRLWRTDEPLRLASVRSNAAAVAVACRRGTG